MISALRHTWPLLLVAFAATSRAQTGSLDQTSPATNAMFNGDSSSLHWQQQVRAGLGGQLEGFSLTLLGAQGATLSVRVRIGPGWNTTPIVFQTTLTKPTSGADVLFVDVTSATIVVAPGSEFVIEMQGLDTGTEIVGSHVPSGPPLYPEPLFLDGPGCFAGCGWRIGFMSYVLTRSGTPFCFGDGTGTACPCANTGAAGNGCASSANSNGGNLAATGTTSVSADTLLLTGSGMPDAPALYLQGSSQRNAVFGDGLRCVAGQLVVLGRKQNANGTSHYPAGGDPPVSVRGSVPAAGGVRTYQCWYRNAATFCTPATFNLTNGVEITWTP